MRQTCRWPRRRESSARPRDPSPSRRDSAIRPSHTARRRARPRARNGAVAPAACGRSCRAPTSWRPWSTEACDAGRDIRNLYTTELVRIISAGGAPSNNAILPQPEMNASTASQPQLQQTDADGMTRIGGWLFRRRTIIPLPLALAVLLVPGRGTHPIERWSLRESSWSRSARRSASGACATSARSRGPAAIGSARSSRPVRLRWCAIRSISATSPSGSASRSAPTSSGSRRSFVVVLAFEYHAIVRWEERLLRGTPRRAVPRLRRAGAAMDTDRQSRQRRTIRPASQTRRRELFSWRETFYSERGTLIAIAIGFALLWLKAQA